MKSFLTILISIGIGAGANAFAQPHRPLCKPIYDALLYQNKPTTEELGLQRISLVYEHQLWGSLERRNTMPPPSNITKAVGEAVSPIILLDVESLPLSGPPSTVSESRKILREILNVARATKVNAKFGYYGLSTIGDQSDDLPNLASSVDIAFPSLYTVQASKEDWSNHARKEILKARQVAGPKKVVPFLWPKFHEAAVFGAGTYLDQDLWRTELALALELADGVVLWGGYKETWDANAAWWITTKKFLCRRVTKP